MKTSTIFFLWIGIFMLFQTQLKAQINTKVENFSLPNLTDGSTTTLESYANSPCVVLVFTSAYCPYSKSYKDRIIKLSQKYQDKGVLFLLINPESEQDSEESMKNAAKEYNMPYLLDKGQKVTSQLKASKTPEVFVLQQNLGIFTIKYFGAIDDNPQLADEVTKPYLESAIQAILEKRPLEIINQKPTGCMIKGTSKN